MKNYMVHCKLLIVIHVEEYSERCNTFLDEVKKSNAICNGIIECETEEDFSHRYLELDNTCTWYYKAGGKGLLPLLHISLVTTI